MRKLSTAEKTRLYNKYKNAKTMGQLAESIINYPYEELPDITFNMLKVLEERQKYFNELEDSHPMKGHGGTPHIIDNSTGLQRKKQALKHEDRINKAGDKYVAQLQKVKDYTDKVIERKKRSLIKVGSSTATDLTQKRLTAVTRIKELAKWWNKNSKKTSADELAKVWEELKTLAPVAQDTVFIQANEKTLWVDQPIINNDIFLSSKFETFKIQSYNALEKRLIKKVEACKKADYGQTEDYKAEQNQTIIKMQDAGVVTQWKKKPHLYFIKGYDKVAICTARDGGVAFSIRYEPKSEQEKNEILELINKYK